MPGYVVITHEWSGPKTLYLQPFCLRRKVFYMACVLDQKSQKDLQVVDFCLSFKVSLLLLHISIQTYLK